MVLLLSDKITLFVNKMLLFSDRITFLRRYKLIYYCVKSSEYLADILDKVSRGAEYFLQIEIPQQKVESLINKWSERYNLEQSARQRTYRLKTAPVVDLIVLQTQAMNKFNLVRLCLLVTLPQQYRQHLNLNEVQKYIKEGFKLDKAQRESFTSVYDRKHRLTLHTVLARGVETIPVYELIELPFTKTERKQKELNKDKGWTWRLHKNFINLKLDLIEQAFKDAQGLKDHKKQDAKILKEMEILWGMSGFRGVRRDIFKINSKLRGLTFKYLNRRNMIELKVPIYTIKSKRLVRNLDDMRQFHIRKDRLFSQQT